MMQTFFRWIRLLLILVVLLQTAHGARKRRRPTTPQISWKQFRKAVTENGFPPPRYSQYHGFSHALGYAGINKKREAAMFLAQLLHESGGLRFKEELAYKNKRNDPYKSPVGLPGRRYYGRGYIQLSWPENYRSASKGIYGDDRLLKHPDLVAKDEKAAFLTAGWYWKHRVAVHPAVRKGKFGATTKAIHGDVECTGEYIKNSKNRFKKYKVVFNVFGVKGTPNERGCYN